MFLLTVISAIFCCYSGSGCKKSDELQTAATIIGIVTFVAFAAIFIVVAFILLFKVSNIQFILDL